MDGKLFFTILVLTIYGHNTFAGDDMYPYEADPELVNRILNIKEMYNVIESIGNYLNYESMLSSSAEEIKKSYKAVRAKIKKQKEDNAALRLRITSAEYPIKNSKEILDALTKQDIALNKFEKSVRSFMRTTGSVKRKTNSMKTTLNTANDTVVDAKEIIGVYLVPNEGDPRPGNPCVLNNKVCGDNGKCTFGVGFYCECAGFYRGTYCEIRTEEECTLRCPFDIGDRQSKCLVYNGIQTCECPSMLIADLGCVAVPGSNKDFGRCRMNCEDEEEEEEEE
ncbi:unnamed protein product [Owenia fusiformis]|uniref:EGF-like domain-containing protein n=1 Tax=Owenia fusiformis TaxID=6347 RepID=A0A8S4NGZ3_OWEFU|nr:unnamed protein product [Owenia fusiformis]